MKKKITKVQAEILARLREEGRAFGPVHSLKLLQKKGLVVGNKRKGWTLTKEGEEIGIRTRTKGEVPEVLGR